jgi:two-component system sensor histidine kinase UhpB
MSNFLRARASLRTRLILIPSALLGFGVVVAIFVTLFDAKGRIDSEIASGVNLGSVLIEYALDNVGASSDPEAALKQLQLELSRVRHISVSYLVGPEDRRETPPQPKTPSKAPDWFLNLFQPAMPVKSYPVNIDGRTHGELVVSTRPSDEAAEIWGSLIFSTTLLGAISISIVTLIALTARQTLKPLNDLMDGLSRLQRGQFDDLDEIRIVELREIGEQFNRLARGLARTEADNHLLIDRLMSIQESERKELARELHDEFGAALFGIRVAVACIIEDASSDSGEERMQEIVTRAASISSLVDTIQKQNYRILERIRPLTLHQIGLMDAIGDLVNQWRAAHRDVACDVHLPSDRLPLSEDVSLAAYRMVQECLTNVARHAKAHSVQIVMRWLRPRDGHPAGAESQISMHVSIEDDGVGLPSDLRFGFGLLGMSERIRKVGGRFDVRRGPRTGALIEAVIPLVASA